MSGMSSTAFQVYVPSASLELNYALQQGINQAVVSSLKNSNMFMDMVVKDIIKQAVDSQ